MPLFFIFIIIPLIELMILLEVGSIIGSGWTFIIIIATAILGTKLVKQQGVQTWTKIQQELATGSLPAQAMFDGICILVSGVLLITPGFMTDIFGLLLLTPPFRKAVYLQVGHRVQVRGAGFNTSGFGQGGGGFSNQSTGRTFENEMDQNTHQDTGDSSSNSQQGYIDENPQQPTTIDGEYKRKE